MAPRMKIESAQPTAPKQPAATHRPTSSSSASTTGGASQRPAEAQAATPKRRVAKVVVDSAPQAAEPATAKPTAQAKAGTSPKSTPAAKVAKASTAKTYVSPAPKVASTAQGTSASGAQAAQEDPVEATSGNDRRFDVGRAQRSATGWVHRTFPGHEHAFWGAMLALVVAVLVFAIGFWRVLFIALLVVVGVAVGQLFDGDPKILAAIRELFQSDRGQQ